MPDPKRYESMLPSPLVVVFWLNEQNQMRPIACATEEKREDSVNRAAQCFNYSTHDYVPYSELEAAQRRIAELEKAARDFKKHADDLARNVYDEYHANVSLSVHEVGQLLLRCHETGSALDALLKP